MAPKRVFTQNGLQIPMKPGEALRELPALHMTMHAGCDFSQSREVGQQIVLVRFVTFEELEKDTMPTLRHFRAGDVDKALAAVSRQDPGRMNAGFFAQGVHPLQFRMDRGGRVVAGAMNPENSLRIALFARDQVGRVLRMIEQTQAIVVFRKLLPDGNFCQGFQSRQQHVLADEMIFSFHGFQDRPFLTWFVFPPNGEPRIR